MGEMELFKLGHDFSSHVQEVHVMGLGRMIGGQDVWCLVTVV